MELRNARRHSLRSCPARNLIGSTAAERYPLGGITLRPVFRPPSTDLPARALQDQLDGFTLVELRLDIAIDALSESLERFGPVIRQPFVGIQEIAQYLTPLQSFPTRYVGVDLGPWTAFVTNGWGAIANVDGYAVSRRTGCRALGLRLTAEGREFHAYEAEKKQREIISCEDGDRWHYSESGNLMPFEDRDDASMTPARRRLSLDRVRRYAEQYTGFALPKFEELRDHDAVGLERSVKDLKARVEVYPTLPLPSGAA